MSEPIKKALLESLRIVVLAILPIIVAGIESGMVDFRLIAVTGGLAFLRFIDKLLHEMGKESGDDGMKMGLTRF